MAVFTVSTFATFVGLLLAAKKLAIDPDPLNRVQALADLATGSKALAAVLSGAGLTALAKQMETRARDADAAFAREPAAEGARAIFWQVAPVALADPALMAAGALDPTTVEDGMVTAILASPHGDDFAKTELAERYFRAVAKPTLATMLASADFIAGIEHALWRRLLRDNGIQLKLLERLGTKVDALPEMIVARLISELERRGETETAHRAGVSDDRILALARRIAAHVPDLDRAFAELDRAVTIAIEVQTRGALGSNSGHVVDDVLARMADLSAENRDTEAAAEADRAFAEWEDRQRLETQKGVALLEAGLRADILRRDPASAARRIARKFEIELPDPAHLFAALRAEQDEWHAYGRDKGLNFDLEVAIDLARLTEAHARNSYERGTVLNDLGRALTTLGDREEGTVRLGEAIAAFEVALVEWPKGRFPLDWASAKNGLGTALRAIGVREPGTTRLEAAVRAFREALTVYTTERTPADWGIVQNNLASALTSWGERESGTERLSEAVAAHRAALLVRTRKERPEDWATTQNNLGNALKTLAGRDQKRAQAWLDAAIEAFHAALDIWTRNEVPIQWARVQMNLGNALWMSGRLEDAIEAYSAALEEWTSERVPLDWATGYGNQGVALGSLAMQRADALMAQRALAQITDAERVLREGGHLRNADYFLGRRRDAEALLVRLSRL